MNDAMLKLFCKSVFSESCKILIEEGAVKIHIQGEKLKTQLARYVKSGIFFCLCQFSYC